MSKIIQQKEGSVCEPCIAYHEGMQEYFEDDLDTLEHVAKAHDEWSQLGDIVLTSVEDEPQSHFGHFCIVCGTPPYAGTVYDYTFTIFERKSQ